MLVHPLSLAASGTTYFTADHHLWPDELPESLKSFCEALKNEDTWWILGDFFEVWLENHWKIRPGYESLLKLLKDTVSKGVEIKLLVGNRDFAAGRLLEKETGLKVYHGAWSFEAMGKQQLVIHGDELLPSDLSYQKFKKVIRNPLLKSCLKCLPMSLLLKLAGKTRNHSRDKINSISYDQFKMEPELIREVCEKNHIVKCWAGHLHRSERKSFSMQHGLMEVEILEQSTPDKLSSLVWMPDSKPEIKVWT